MSERFYRILCVWQKSLTVLVILGVLLTVLSHVAGLGLQVWIDRFLLVGMSLIAVSGIFTARRALGRNLSIPS